MCIGCYEGYDSPAVITPETRAAAKLIEAVRSECPAGGELHIVIDDWNLEDDSLAFCKQYIKTDAERACHDALAKMSLDERASAMALADGYLAE